MENQNQNSEHPIVSEEATKKCPHCGESLPEKIAFCLYCMKPLSADTVQKFNAQQQNNESNEGNRANKKVIKTVAVIGAVVVLLVIAVVATSLITSAILLGQNNHFIRHNQPITQAPPPQPDADLPADQTTISRPAEQPSEIIATPAPATPNPDETNHANTGSGPFGATISLERAIEIAYADLAERNINATFRSDSGMSWERGQWVWELLFSTQGERMPLIEYYINVGDGSIVKFEWDD